jgi:hypothetical protein
VKSEKGRVKNGERAPKPRKESFPGTPRLGRAFFDFANVWQNPAIFAKHWQNVRGLRLVCGNGGTASDAAV